jgi:glycosyltransferase involved in cell wall biosynthesis
MVVSLTAIVPNYNHGRFLARAILALQSQDPAPSEILIIDDASTDDSVSVIQRLAASCSSIRFLRNECNLGTVPSQNRGISESRSKYIYLAAADDVVYPGFFSKALAMLEKYPEAAFACGECEITNEFGTVLAVRPPARPTQKAAYLAPSVVPKLLRRIDNWGITGSAILRRDVVLSAGSMDSRLASFADGFLLRKLALRHGFCFIPSIVAQWMIRSEGYSRSIAADPRKSLELLDVACRKIAEDTDFPDWYPELFRRRLRFNISYIAACSDPPNRELLNKVAVRGSLDRLIVDSTLSFPHWGRSLTAVWLAARMRPYSFMALAQTALARRVQAWYRK